MKKLSPEFIEKTRGIIRALMEGWERDAAGHVSPSRDTERNAVMERARDWGAYLLAIKRRLEETVDAGTPNADSLKVKLWHEVTVSNQTPKEYIAAHEVRVFQHGITEIVDAEGKSIDCFDTALLRCICITAQMAASRSRREASMEFVESLVKDLAAALPNGEHPEDESWKHAWNELSDEAQHELTRVYNRAESWLLGLLAQRRREQKTGGDENENTCI